MLILIYFKHFSIRGIFIIMARTLAECLHDLDILDQLTAASLTEV